MKNQFLITSNEPLQAVPTVRPECIVKYQSQIGII